MKLTEDKSIHMEACGGQFHGQIVENERKKKSQIEINKAC
jgi:hypothetical protein